MEKNREEKFRESLLINRPYLPVWYLPDPAFNTYILIRQIKYNSSINKTMYGCR